MGAMIEKQCEYCGKIFRSRVRAIALGMGRYCSLACCNGPRKKIRQIPRERRPVPIKIDKPCQVCNKMIRTTLSQLNIGRGRYCSRECHCTAQRGNASPTVKVLKRRALEKVATLRFPQKVSARKKVKWAVATGVLIKPAICSNCGASKRLHGHHDDYSKPLEVVWLCVSCHHKRHSGPRGPRIHMATGLVAEWLEGRA
jgi:hypothetical protein